MKSIRLLSWNVRGVCNALMRNLIKDVVKDGRANFICLQETKCEKWNSSSIKQLWANDDFGWAEVNTRGNSGGLLCS